MLSRWKTSCALVCFLSLPLAGQTTTDEEQLGQLLERWVSARNANDVERCDRCSTRRWTRCECQMEP